MAARGAHFPGTLLLKGCTDIIVDGNRERLNWTGDPAMTVGGTGDVLAGIAGGLLCHLPAFEAGCIAAYVNGRAGQYVAAPRGEGMLASDLVDRIRADCLKKVNEWQSLRISIMTGHRWSISVPGMR